MDVVQWLAPLPDRSDLAVAFAPAWADRLPQTRHLPALRRRSAPLVCRHLSRPVAVAVAVDVADDDRDARVPRAPGAVTLTLLLSAEGAPVVEAAADDVAFASVLAEFIGVVVDVVEAAGLPLMGVVPAEERRGLTIVLGGLMGLSRSRLADALLLFAGAVEMCALARGFQARAFVGHGDKRFAIDGRLEEAL
jgi:hypothetical protein